MDVLAQSCPGVIAKSRLFTTPCFPAGAGPDYVNAAMSVEWSGSGAALLAHLHAIEADFARQRDRRWAARPLDLDLIALEDQVTPGLQTWNTWRNLPLAKQHVQAPDQLILPHPRLQDRPFVLVPLADVAPDWCHPVIGLSVRQMLAAFTPDELAAITPL